MRRLALAVLGAAPLVLLVVSFLDGATAWLLAAAAAASLPPAAMLLGLGRNPHRGAVAAIAVLWTLLAGSLVGAVLLGLRPPAESGPLGLPWSSLLVLVGIGLLPLVLVAAAYAATFRPPATAPSGPPPAAS